MFSYFLLFKKIKVLQTKPSGARALSGKHDRRSSSSGFCEANVVLNGRRGRPRLFITREQIDFFLDLQFGSREIASLLANWSQ